MGGGMSQNRNILTYYKKQKTNRTPTYSNGKKFKNKGILKNESEERNEEYIAVEAIRSSTSILVTTTLSGN